MDKKPCPTCGKAINLTSQLCISCNTRKQWADPEQRKHKIQANRKAHPPLPRPLCENCGILLKTLGAKYCRQCAPQFTITKRCLTGHKTSEATKEKIRQRILAKMQDPLWRNNWLQTIKTRSQNPFWRHKQKVGASARSKTPTWIERHKATAKSLAQTPEWRKAMFNNPCWQRAEKHPTWKGGQNKRLGIAYKEWRTNIFKRDDYTCQYCNIRGSRLHAHHLSPFTNNPDKRLDISNGITLCVKCHSQHHQHYIPA